jgi:hypothetical protein
MRAFSEASDVALLRTQIAQSRDSVFRSLLLTELLARPKLITEALVKLVLLSCPLINDKLIDYKQLEELHQTLVMSKTQRPQHSQSSPAMQILAK